jgi:ketosteroid isomerase-like protein
MSPDEWITAYGLAWRTKDADAVTRLFTVDGIYQSSPTEQAHVGSEAIAAYWRRATDTQQDLALHFGRPIVEGDRVAVEWWATMRDPEWRPDAQSEEVTLPGCLLLRFSAGGLCVHLREYYNPLFGSTVLPPQLWGS